MKKMNFEIENNEKITAVIFDNGVAVVNTTPHSITIENTDGSVTEVPKSVILNAKPVERQVSHLFVKTDFEGTPEGKKIIQQISDGFAATGKTETLVIVGSVIAAQAYPGRVVAMCPVPGYERVAPDQKRMRCDKFTIF